MKTAGYAAAHFFVDLCCALLLFRYFLRHPDWMLALLLYNFCAFALQLPFGILADRLNRNHVVAATGMLLTAAAFLTARWMPVSVILAGCGNGLFHVGGGIEILNKSVHKAFRLGIFVAPGALGLFLGRCLGKTAWSLWPLPALLGIAAVGLLILGRKATRNARPIPPRLQPGIWALFGVVVLRSYLGFCMKFSWNTGFRTGLLIALVTVLGKMAGGFLLDRLGYLPTAFFSLLPAACCLLRPEWMGLGLLGLFFFQMTMPVTLWAAARCCPGAKGFSFGLLTFALFLGFLPTLLGLPALSNRFFLAGVVLLSLLLLFLGRRCAASSYT